jgi:hypothetical protein
MKDHALAELGSAERARQLWQMWRETSPEGKSQWVAQAPSVTPKALAKKRFRERPSMEPNRAGDPCW